MIPGQPFIQPSVHLISCFFFSEQLCIFCFPHRSGIEISLSLVTAEPLKHYLLLFSLHTFRNDGGSYTRDRIGSDVCLNNIYELGSRLCELLSTLKKNREYVPLEILQTQYRIPYESLKKQIGDTATAFVKEITLSKLMINPDVSLEEQISVIQQAITTSGMLKEMSYTLSKLYDVELLHRQALKLRTYIEDALYPYIALQDCLVVDMERIEDTPIIYNTITQKVYENGQWSKQDLDLHGKLLIYVKSSPPMPAATEQINNGF